MVLIVLAATWHLLAPDPLSAQRPTPSDSGDLNPPWQELSAEFSVVPLLAIGPVATSGQWWFGLRPGVGLGFEGFPVRAVLDANTLLRSCALSQSEREWDCGLHAELGLGLSSAYALKWSLAGASPFAAGTVGLRRWDGDASPYYSLELGFLRPIGEVSAASASVRWEDPLRPAPLGGMLWLTIAFRLESDQASPRVGGRL